MAACICDPALVPLLCRRPLSDDMRPNTGKAESALYVSLCEACAVWLTFEDGGPPLHIVLVPADPPELGGPLPSGDLAQGTGLHSHSQASTTDTASIAPATAVGGVALP